MREWLGALRGTRLGAAYSTTGWVMPFDLVDLAWLCKALAGESSGAVGPESDAVAWAMIQFAYLHRNDVLHRKDGRDLLPPHGLSDVLLYYCQPINPSWRNDGTDDQVARRRRFAAMTPEQCERWYPGLIVHCIGILTGRVGGEPYRGFVDFAECEWGEGRHGDPAANYGGNCFWFAEGSNLWRPGLVKVSAPRGRSAAGLLVPLGLQLAGGLAVAFGPRIAAVAGALPFVRP